MVITLIVTFLSGIVSFFTGHSPLYWIYYYIARCYLWLYKKQNCFRFDLYDYNADEDPEKTNFFVPRQEWELDAQREVTDPWGLKANDVFCYGVSKSESLAIHISHRPDGKVISSLILHSNGKTYSLSDSCVLQRQSGELYTFGSTRLKLQCILPLRKWRIFFNGLLVEDDADDDGNRSSAHKHVRFTFIWTASSYPFDFTWHVSEKELAEAAANPPSWRCHPVDFIKKIKKIFNSFEQPGMIHGTLQIEDENEKQVHMWGVRGRYLGECRNLEKASFTDYHGSFENGALIHLGILNYPGLVSRFVFGYVMRADGFMFPIEKCIERVSTDSKTSFSFVCHDCEYVFEAEKNKGKAVTFYKEYGCSGTSQCSEMKMDGKRGCGLIFTGTEKSSLKMTRYGMKSQSAEGGQIPDDYCIPFESEACRYSELTGGKGSSLGKLYSLQKGIKNETSELVFEVPNGIVVTTKGYEAFTQGLLEKALNDFQKTVWKSGSESVEELCQKMCKKVIDAELPESLKESVIRNLKNTFHPEQVSNIKFAVRSSAVGEDTEQMSAAGQMETFLGVSGFEEVLEALKNCWASQFSFQAIMYKRRYGQILNSPMAVVIQQMVPCEAAGVMFTCDPVTGNPKYISITANWGLGESVVSATAEPDSFLLKRDNENGLEVYSQMLGKKNKKIIMDESHGTKEVESGGDSEALCLSQETLLRLGKIAAQIEAYFATSVDIEWGILAGKVFVFQARPVTSLDVETDYENKHFFDTYMRTEAEYFTKANVGEVMPGATSPLGIDMMTNGLESFNKRSGFLKWEFENVPDFPYYEIGFVYSHYQAFFNVVDGFMNMDKGNEAILNSVMISMFGRIIDDSEMFAMGQERHHKYSKKKKRMFLMKLYTTVTMFAAGIVSRRLSKKLDSFSIPHENRNNAKELLQIIGRHYLIISDCIKGNTDCIMACSFWNLTLLNLLARAEGGYDNDVLSDFSYLVSNSQKVESADIPSSLEKLGRIIGQCVNPEAFRKMNAKEALEWLKTSSSEAGVQFQKFLEKHGHRCLKEFDMRSRPWGDAPESLVALLQNLVVSDNKRPVKDEPASISSILKHMHVKMNFLSRLLLHIIIPNCRRGVRDREFAKSVLIRSVNLVKRSFHHLAEVMVEEGRLPEKDLLFFLTVEEINQLIKTRSPRIVTRAIKRQKCFPELDRLIFPEIAKGIPKPINLAESFVPTGKELMMTGVPVSQGVVKATARVVLHLEDAHTIQPGDILITYATDVGWSPYFPLLSGVVTELGGLISHGAVVAREYGLPCVVALHGATLAFKSGDTVVLDGTKGTIQKVETE